MSRGRELLDDVWRRLPLSQSVRDRAQALFPSVATALSNQGPPPSRFKRPPPRLRAPVVRGDERAIGFQGPTDCPAVSAAPPHLVALHVGSDDATWRRVAAALPQFDGHAQPRLPGELGFHRGGEALAAQIELARRHGVSAFAFCVAEEPSAALERFLAEPSLSFSMCLVTPLVAGAERAALVVRCLREPRRLELDGRPLLVVGPAPAPAGGRAILDGWRQACRAAGIGEIAIAVRQSVRGADPRPLGFDLALSDTLVPEELAVITPRQLLSNPAFGGQVLDWRDAPRAAGARPEHPSIPIVHVGLDDEPLRPGAGVVLAHASPRGYRDWLAQTLAEVRREARPPFVFVDSWNDWARGAVLEPDTRTGHGYLAATRAAVLGPPGRAPDPRPCAVVHAYHLDVLDEIGLLLRATGVEWRVLVTTPADRSRAARDKLAALGIEAEIEEHENRGRDILPFLRVAHRLLDEGVDVVCKLHTKRSDHRTDGDRWRAELLGRILERSRVEAIRRAFATDPRLGAVAPEGHVLPLSAYWGWNEENVRYLCVRMGIPDPDPSRDHFAAGSMLWLRLSALRPLLDAHLGEWEIEPEGGYVDGTMPHAIERALSLCVRAAGSSLRTAAEVCGLPTESGGGYAFAEATGAPPEE